MAGSKIRPRRQDLRTVIRYLHIQSDDASNKATWPDRVQYHDSLRRKAAAYRRAIRTLAKAWKLHD